MDGSIGGGVDPIVEIYRLAKFGLDCLWTCQTSRVPSPCWAVGDDNGGPPPVDDWFKTSNAVLNSYPETYRLLVEILDGIRKLRRTQTVGELVFRTLAREQRDGAYIDQAIRIIERGAGLFLRLSELPNPTVQTEVSYWNLHEQCRQTWFEFGYEREEFEGLFARLDWERSTIDLDRRPNYQTGQTPPVVSDSQPTPSETVPSEYQRLWDYAQKMWSPESDKFRICECLQNGPSGYSSLLDHLIVGVDRSKRTLRFHAVVGELNKEVRDKLGLEVYRTYRGEQVLICGAGQKPTRKKPIAKRSTTKKSTTKRKR